MADPVSYTHLNLAEQQNARADDLGDHTHHADNGMYLRQVTAGGAELFPDVWNGIDADDIDSLVDEIEHVVDHLIEDNRVRIVDVYKRQDYSDRIAQESHLNSLSHQKTDLLLMHSGC